MEQMTKMEQAELTEQDSGMNDEKGDGRDCGRESGSSGADVLQEMAERILEGYRLDPVRDLDFCQQLETAPFAAAGKAADRIRARFRKDVVDLCSIINGRSGLCGEDCKFCAQSCHHSTGCERYPLLDQATILHAAGENQQEGVNRFAVVTSGRGPSEEDFEKLLDIYARMHRTLSIQLCSSLGFLSEDQFRRLRAAGVTSYHCNIETSRHFFPKICTTHSFEDKLENIRRARAAGLSVCSGGIIGMGETWQDRIDMAFTLKELDIRSIPINSLVPVPGTPLEGLPRLTEEEILRTIILFRFINPEANIRLAGGRALMEQSGRNAFLMGASATITGNMLTTSGSTIRQDRRMLQGLGRTVIEPSALPEQSPAN